MKTFKHRAGKLFSTGMLFAGILFLLQTSPLQAQDDNQGPPPDQNQVQNAPGPNDQGPPPDGQQQDPPTRVARLNYMDGSVSFQPGGQGDWVQAVPNRPLTTGDNLWADVNSKAELHVGSTAIRMGSETSLTFLELDDRTTQLKLSQGTILLRVRHLDDEDLFEVDTPNLAFTISRIGEYRINVNAAGDQTITTVYHGRGEVTGGGASYDVIAGQQARFSGTDQLDHEIDQLPPQDDFDSWAFDRDQREDRAESSNYISPETTGYEDLDEYGHWRYVADYGPVWTPTAVAPGWAPYRFGHWVFVAPWGWTWVEDEPWGFAPFHYGRWAYVGAGWCWVPGPVVVRPVYAPALVAFVGGGGIGVGVGVGVAWFPLAPHEVFVPWYRGSREYVNNVNVTNTRVNVTQVTNVYNTTIINNNTTNVTRITYANQHVPTAITAVSHETFVNARPVSRNIAQVDTARLAEARVVHAAPAQPLRASVMGTGAPARFRPPAAVMSRQVVATRNPSPPRPAFGERPAVTNVRTEAPTKPHPVEMPESQTPRTVPQTNRPAEPQPNRASEPNRPAEPQPNRAPGNQPNRAPEPNRVAEPAPETNRAPQPAPPRPAPPRPPTRGSQPAPQPNPQVRPAPPVQNRPEVQRQEEQKFNNWQQQRPKSAPPAPHASVPRPPAPHPPSSKK